ncbi:retron Se72 family effector protein [Pseudoalteromonas carrageenovora]|uniref:retron Se72 family effector protein n=1 Tax=Pseudoalteromonas carrageenovora TaxID=227 RepID=UPI0026E31A11|nr:retron Se72 family effector protein [Pseudoalteromonas carrageenovora]MDO6834052.1 retron Se72 family effector protein [Pseudoalteromonas carrageenovora]
MGNIQKEEKGVIHAYDAFKGFGFIRREKGKDVFFLYDQFKDSSTEPAEGDIVTFDVLSKKKGPAAINITKTGNKEL